MAEKTFSKKIQDIMGENAPNELTGGLWRGKPYSHIYLDKKYNFIDGKFPEKCDVKGKYFGEEKTIKYHNGASHLNSSQVVCINFFKKFFEKQEWEDSDILSLKEEKASGHIFLQVSKKSDYNLFYSSFHSFIYRMF